MPAQEHFAVPHGGPFGQVAHLNEMCARQDCPGGAVLWSAREVVPPPFAGMSGVPWALHRALGPTIALDGAERREIEGPTTGAVPALLTPRSAQDA